MGPPLSNWPYSYPCRSDSDKVQSDKCPSVQLVENIRVICLNFTILFIFLQVLLSLSSVGAGPVVLNLDYSQGPVPLARNIRHLPCISRRTGQEGLCMFAIDCLKANGSHLGTCIDRFYFGSCCQIPDKTILPQIISNNIDDNTIDGANFVHPQTEDKTTTVSKVTEGLASTERVTVPYKPPLADRTDPDVETKSDELTTIDNKIIDNDVKLTTAVSIETTTKSSESKPSYKPVTELPIKLSTFQTVSDVNSVTDKPKEDAKPTTNKPKPTVSRKPIKPTYKPRPSYRPTNFTRPSFSPSTLKPRPTKPIQAFNATRKPPYRPLSTKPSTRKPLPSPPRLNITILPQSTSSKPTFTRPSSVSITYINTTNEEKPITSSSTSSSTTTSTTSTTTTSTTTTTEAPRTEKVTEATEPITETPSATESLTEKTVEIPTTSEALLFNTFETSPTETNQETTLQEIATEKEVLIPVTEADVPLTTISEPLTTPPPLTTETSSLPPVTSSVAPETSAAPVTTTTPVTTSAPVTTAAVTSPASSTEFPPFVTWTNTIEVATKVPEKVTEPSEEIWSPITPPDGWVLISTIPPKPETSSSTSTSTTTTSPTTTTTEPPSTEEASTTEKAASSPTSTSPVLPTATSLATEIPTSTSEPPQMEFTVNVTLSPTVPTTTSSIGLTTFTSVTSDNTTQSDVSTTAAAAESSSSAPTTTPTSVETTTEALNMSNYKEVCGRRLWQAPEARIVGGSKSGFGQWPWQISLRQYRTSTYLHKCGAALLNENWAITAAHCVEHVPPSELLVRLGEHDLANEDEPYGFAERRVQIVASHPHFDPATFEYDLALLRFYEPVSFQPNILPICVPDNDDDYIGKTAYVTGWGRLFDEGPLPSVLQEVQVPVINNSACEAMYHAAGYNEHIPNIFICAGRSVGGTDSCEGDSGGPMAIQRDKDNRFVLGGVISWGIGCAEPNQPGVYTRISEFRDWINQILQF